MKYLSAIASLAIGAVALWSCSGDNLRGPEDSEHGYVRNFGLNVTNAEKVMNDKGVTSKASYDVSDYIVEFYKDGATEASYTYVYGDMPGTVELPVGLYTVKVRSHDLQKAEWERPYFTGQSSQFEVKSGQITEVDQIVCTFASLKVSIKFGPKLMAAASGDVKVTVVANDEGKLEYGINETRAGYFATVDGSTTLAATLTGTINGYNYNDQPIVRSFTDVAAGQHRIITYELGGDLPNPGEPSGSIGGEGIDIDVTYVDENLTVKVDPGKEETEGDDDEPGKLPEIPGGDEPGPTPPDNPDNPDDTEPISFSGTLEDNGVYMTSDFVVDEEVIKPAYVTISCTSGCAEVLVDIDSEFLNAQMLQGVGLTNKFSLVGDTGTYGQALFGLGLPCGDGSETFETVDGEQVPNTKPVKNQKSINFDITTFMSLLEIGKGSTNKFTLTVTDNEGKTQTMVFTIKVP